MVEKHVLAQRLTNADKKRIVEAMLRDLEWGQWSNVAIARHCGVSHKTVSRYRNDILVNDKDQGSDAKQDSVRKFNRNGKTYEMGVSNLGNRKPPTDAAPELPLPSAQKNGYNCTHFASHRTDAAPELPLPSRPMDKIAPRHLPD